MSEISQTTVVLIWCIAIINTLNMILSIRSFLLRRSAARSRGGATDGSSVWLGVSASESPNPNAQSATQLAVGGDGAGSAEPASPRLCDLCGGRCTIYKEEWNEVTTCPRCGGAGSAPESAAPDATRRDERSQPAVGLPRPGEAVSELAAYKSALDDLFMAAEDMHDAWEKMLKAAASVQPNTSGQPRLTQGEKHEEIK